MSTTASAARRSKGRISPVETREELLYLLTRASELEHDLACSYLYAGYSIKTRLDEGGLTESELATIRTWKSKIAGVAVEEMLHLGQVSNILTAVGGSSHFVRPNLPLPPASFPFGIKIALEPLSQELIERFVCYEMPEAGVLSAERMAEYDDMRRRSTVGVDDTELIRLQNSIEPFDIDFKTVGEFYHKIQIGFRWGARGSALHWRSVSAGQSGVPGSSQRARAGRQSRVRV